METAIDVRACPPENEGANLPRVHPDAALAPSTSDPTKDMLDFAEQAGQENIKFHIECGDCLAKEANTTLTILLASAGASLGYWVKLLELANHPVLSGGTLVASLYLFALAFTLVHTALAVGPLQAPTNEPKHLLQPGYTVELVREVELENLQKRIELNVARNDRKALWLKRVRIALIFVPLFFAFGAAIGAIIAL